MSKSNLAKTGMLIKALLRLTPLASWADIPDDLRGLTANDSIADFVDLAASRVDRGRATIEASQRAAALTVMRTILEEADSNPLLSAALQGADALMGHLDTSSNRALLKSADLTDAGVAYFEELVQVTALLISEWLHSPRADGRAQSAALGSTLELLGRIERGNVLTNREVQAVRQAFDNWCELNSDTASKAVNVFVGQLSDLRRWAGFATNNDMIDGFNQHAARLGVEQTSGDAINRLLSATCTELPDWSTFVRPFVSTCFDESLDPDSPASLAGADLGGIADWELYHLLASAGLQTASPILKPKMRQRSPKHSRSAAELRKQECRSEVLIGEGIVRTLEGIYDEALVTLAGHKFPIAVFPATAMRWKPDESCLEAGKGDLLTRRLPSWQEYSSDWDPAGQAKFDQCLRRYAQGGPSDRRRFFSGSTFAFDKMRATPEGPRIDARLGRYFASLATSEDLDGELIERLQAAPMRPVYLDELPRRKWLHDRVDSPVFDGAHRAAALSHGTVVLLAEEQGGYDMLLPFRSKSVATHAHFNHIAPSGIFSPHTEVDYPPINEYSIERNFFREWVEEMYAQDVHERPPFIPGPDPEGEPEAIRLKAALSSGDASLYYTGISVNLLTLRPEFCLLLVIDNPSWFDHERRLARETGRPLKFGWEYSRRPGKVRHRTSRQPHHWRLSLASDLSPNPGQVLEPDFLVPNAAGAIALATLALQSP